MNPKHASRLAWVLGTVLLLAGTAQAETIYKYKGPDGVMVYSTTRPKNTPILAEMDSAALSNDQRTIYHSQAAAGQSGAAADAHLQRIAEADANVTRAQQNLKNAQDALERGREPLPGEHIGTVSGYSRLNDTYEQRIAALESAVTLAQQQLDAAYRARSNS